MRAQVGDVFRMSQNGAFADAVVLRVDDDGRADLVRPYLYISLPDTTCPSPLMGYEKVLGVPESLYSTWQLVGAGRTT